MSPTSASTKNKVPVMPTSVSSPATATLLISSDKSKASSPSIFTATPASSTTSSATSISTCATVTAAPDPSVDNHSAKNKSSGDSGSSSSVVSLKIIISDNQEEHSSADPALNQAASSVSGNKVPTIYLNSPVKSPGVPGTPKPKLDETAQVISNSEALQPRSSEVNSAIKKSGAPSPFTGSPAQPSYIIQVPLDTTNSVLQGTTTSYFLVTEPLTPDPPNKQVLVPTGISNGQPLITSHCGVRTPPALSVPLQHSSYSRLFSL
ncbi:protein NPAT-like [Thalassophryne amazonica]|uniref:protein NPAT-like n=1 Tax=Thalassophryne amazonica TaxID=390379 RepID=UPI001471609A|nr:protein NPAT-like [Thalassophryne amazonica]